MLCRLRFASSLCVSGKTLLKSASLSQSRRGLSATLTGTGLDLGAFRRRHENELPAVALQPFADAATDSKQTAKKKGKGEKHTGPGAGGVNATTPPQPCTVRGRLERVRGHGKIAFLHLRQPPSESVQVVCFGKDLAARAMAISPESIVEVEGAMRPAEAVPILSTSCAYHELHARDIRVLSAAAVPLPFPIHDVNTRLDTRLNHRAIDLRTRLTSAVLRIVSAVCQSYRTALLELDFVEVHTPKLIAAASEGGSAVFEVKYFEAAKAYLAQSPQLYKQMCLNGDAMRVFEVGPVFRAEQSMTHRHLTEFTGLDAEMVIREHYTEVLDVLEHVMCRVLGDLQDNRKPAAALVKVAAAALKEQQQQLAESPEEVERREQGGKTTATAALTSSAPSAVSDIVCELSLETIVTYGILSDTDGGKATTAGGSTDMYNARIGGATLEVRVLNTETGEGEETLRKITCPRVLRMSFDGAVRLLHDAKAAEADIEDFSLTEERKLGELIKARYGVDLYVIDGWPMSARPFYTMPCGRPNDNAACDSAAAAPAVRRERTRSYDMYLRGEEICSGAQRQHDAEKLVARLAELGIPLSSDGGARDGLSDYVNSFRYGAWPHGGFGLGLERIVSFFLGARDIRQVSLFPRDPKRLSP